MKILEEAAKRLLEIKAEECFNCEYYLLEEEAYPCGICIDESSWEMWQILKDINEENV